ncbi:sensor histidine kinase [Aurantiacibacter zhengii]|uniref:histidine kinase n=1 Tax=Aurantiacibacter zhengii TaxID=2307003 RepID=A0A418NTQ3_9SPHN|nr:histidine kinase dimerization/phospho-acceptor domain-containing protein [Aurantiacibacter zhengii]RIV87466.1 sensor histidine kinase [Aurantiacibacter zhengii]
MFDDRLATVLRMRAGSEASMRTQFRQLLDLLGMRPTNMPGKELARLARAINDPSGQRQTQAYLRPAPENEEFHLVTLDGFVRLHQLQGAIPQEEQSAILRMSGLRLRNPELVAFLAEGEAKPAAAVVATARLSEDDWLDLIPRLPVTARGFMRHRRDLPARVKRLLQDLGVQDLVLPSDTAVAAEETPVSPSAPAKVGAEAPAPAKAETAEDGIGALRRRIEAFREGRQLGRTAPRLPLGDVAPSTEPFTRDILDLFTDATGIVTRVEGFAAPMLAGLALTAPKPGDLVDFADDVAVQLRRRLPLRGASLAIDAAPEISGEWRMDAAPLFTHETGDFTGYAVRLYRPNRPARPEEESAADAMRQVLHELRTPVNAIQGFAEIIQQQIFGAVPHEYRAHAASIAGDAAMLLAGFDEVDRLVKLESAAMQLEEGTCDLREALVTTVDRLDKVLRARNAGFRLEVSGSPFHVAMDRPDAMALCWRLLATAAGALTPGEEACLELSSDGETITLLLDVPESLRNAAPDTSREGQRRRAISAGMFGPRFTFRLAEAEARAIGGTLVCEQDRVSLQLPALTSPVVAHSSENGTGG